MESRGNQADPKSSPPESNELTTTSAELTEAEQAEDQATEAKMVRLPKSVGFLLMGVGVVGLLAPGPLGTPFIILGGVVLWPSLFRAPDRWLSRRFPGPRHQALKVVQRYVEDMEKRFPARSPGDPEDRSS